MKQLLVVADDFGYGVARNKGLVKCFQENAISTLSLLTSCKHSEQAVHLAKTHKIPVGLHFNLTEGVPLAAPHEVESLIGINGKFLGKSRFWSKCDIDPSHVENELKAQIKSFKRWFGYFPRRVDGHQHVHIHEAVVKVFSQLLSEYKVLSTRLPLEHTFSQTSYDISPQRKLFHRMVEHCSIEAKKEFAKYSIVHPEAFLGLNFMGSAMATNRLRHTIKSVFDSGVTTCELMCHPGFVCEETTDGFIGDAFADPFACSQDRQHEMDILTSQEMLQFYKDEKISLCVKLPQVFV